MRKKYKVFILVLISVLSTSNLGQVWACIGGEYVDIDNMSMIYDGLMKQDDLRIYLPSIHFYNGWMDYYSDTTVINNEDRQNINEWYEQFGKEYQKATLQEIIYKDSAWHLQGFIKKQPAKWKPEFEYLLFAKRVSDTIDVDVHGAYWWPEKKQPADYKPLIELAKSGFNNAGSKFLKQRYGYMEQKLLHVSGQYQAAADWYTTNLANAGLSGTMKYRTLDYYAGSLCHLKKYALSNYLFSRIFDEYPARAYTSYFNFKPQDEKDWQEALAMAKNDHERETLWFLFGLYADINQAMKKIYAINPSSRYLELLLMRSVKMAENSTPEIWKNSGSTDDYMLGGEEGPRDNYYENHTDTFYVQEIYGNMNTVSQEGKEQLASFISSHINDSGIQNKWLWNVSAAYLDLINHHYDKAAELLQLAERNSGTDTMKIAQTNILQLVLKLKTVATLTPVVEGQLLQLIKKLPLHGVYADANAFCFCMRVLKQDYKQRGDSLKAALCNASDLQYFVTDPAKRLVEAETFFRRPDTTALESFLIKHYKYTVNELIYAQGVLKFYQYDFEGAERDFSRFWQTFEPLPADPFLDRINDCHDCDQSAPKKTEYNMLSLVKKIISLKRIAETTTDRREKSGNYFLVGNALYNTSYFGNNRMAASTFLYNGYQNLYDDYTNAWGSWQLPEKNYTNCNEAENYYAKALEYADNDEMKARCTWMMAKCQLNIFYCRDVRSADEHDFYASPAYKQMKADYGKTHYYQEVIKECEYFASYLGMPKKVKKE